MFFVTLVFLKLKSEKKYLLTIMSPASTPLHKGIVCTVGRTTVGIRTSNLAVSLPGSSNSYKIHLGTTIFSQLINYNKK